VQALDRRKLYRKFSATLECLLVTDEKLWKGVMARAFLDFNTLRTGGVI